jgi:serine/threonine protein kinase
MITCLFCFALPQIAFALLLQPPSYFGYKYLHTEEFKLEKVIGQGAHTYVFEVTDKDRKRLVVKVFEKQDEYEVELVNLRQLGNILPGSKHVPRIIRPLVMVKEHTSSQEYKAIMTLPLCEVIRPQRDGLLLQRPHYLQLLHTLHKVHDEHMYNCDVKPCNILLNGNNAVFCDWGSAVFASDGDPTSLPERSVGTVGYSDFNLRVPSPPDASHDLMALVRTVYANYTDQVVPSKEDTADSFWEEKFRNGSLWRKAMVCAQAKNYDGLEQLFLLL